MTENMKTTPNYNLTVSDIEAIAKKTNYSSFTVISLLSGKRRMTARNKIVFELAAKLSNIRRKAEESAEKKIEKVVH